MGLKKKICNFILIAVIFMAIYIFFYAINCKKNVVEDPKNINNINKLKNIKKNIIEKPNDKEIDKLYEQQNKDMYDLPSGVSNFKEYNNDSYADFEEVNNNNNNKLKIYLYYSTNCKYSLNYLPIWNATKNKLMNSKLKENLTLINVDITNPNSINVYGSDDFPVQKNKMLKEITYVPMLIIEDSKGNLINMENQRITPENIEQIYKKYSNL